LGPTLALRPTGQHGECTGIAGGGAPGPQVTGDSATWAADPDQSKDSLVDHSSLASAIWASS
jgi:hypothetical protein